MVTLDKIIKDPYVISLLKESDKTTEAIGYTEHGLVHAKVTSDTAVVICNGLGLSEWESNVAEVASYLHDIGNLSGRDNHGQIGAALVAPILLHHDAEPDELARIVAAIANHDDDNPVISSVTTAVVILADKSDVRRSRVRDQTSTSMDIHDRVNYAVPEGGLTVKDGVVTLSLKLDTDFACSADYMDIFALRMKAMRAASKYLGADFQLLINDIKIY